MAGVGRITGGNITLYCGTTAAYLDAVSASSVATGGAGLDKLKSNLAISDFVGTSKLIDNADLSTNELPDVIRGLPNGVPSAPVSYASMGALREKSLQGIASAQVYPLNFVADLSSATSAKALLMALANDARFVLVGVATKGSVADATKTTSPIDATFLVWLCSKLTSPYSTEEINVPQPIELSVDIRDTKILNQA